MKYTIFTYVSSSYLMSKGAPAIHVKYTTFTVDIDNAVEDGHIYVNGKDIYSLIRLDPLRIRYNQFACNLDTLPQVIKQLQKNFNVCCHLDHGLLELEQGLLENGPCLGDYCKVKIKQ